MDREAQIRKQQGERLKAARLAAGYRSGREAALSNGWPESTYRAHETGSRTMGQDDADRYARRFRAAGARVTARDILFGASDETDHPEQSPHLVPVMGRVGAGATIEPEFDQVPPDGLFEVKLPFPVPDEMIGLEIEGDSMLPVYRAGDVIVVWREQRRGTEDFLGELAAVRTEDGRRFLKTIMRGSQRGLYRLESFNARPVEDVAIAWVGEIHVIVPARQVRHIDRAARSPVTRRQRVREREMLGTKRMV